ncbi:MAG: exodeoxyribonuclease VII large subunit [Bacilli bacterium]|nr:exodeoxyribonuclease VII large subunit [Bacilli bacterium]MDD4795802.1 exodeoxyribonuclease VII large subunit [Bacilli bacterium]
MEKRYITVSTLNRYLKNKFDTDPNLGRVSLKGEISNFKGHTRGHLYFTLKDETSRINAVMFQFNASKLKFKPIDGMTVLVEGKISIYEATGAYQIYVENMEEDGLGNLYLKYEELKKKLAGLGLFNEEHKKKIPKFPEKIGIITAPTGAAVKDILSTIKRRYPICETYLFPCLVQGDLAKDDIVKQINEANNHDLDVLIVGRGGGSIEDLWAFNEEIVAEAIFNSKIPIISAVGHEIDFTIADFVADLRAPTPTGAAEIAVPNIADLNVLISQYKIRTTNLIGHFLKNNKIKLDNLKNSYVLKSPLAVYEQKEQKLSGLLNTLNSIIQNNLQYKINKYTYITKNHIINNPESLFISDQNNYNLMLNKLELLNPISILSKGYSVVKLDDKIIKDVDNIKIGDNLNIKLHQGEIKAKVEKVG